MRHYATLLAIVLLLPAAQAQVIFQSGFEDWTGNTPDGWFGVRTNILASAVTQATNNPHAGNYAVRLENTLTATGDHRRFTTQDLTVNASQSYEVRFWARGRGDIRLGLYDGRSGNGYGPYTSYTSMADDNNWREVTLSVTAAVSATNAQFILSVKSTVAPEHLVIDDVTITAGSVDPPSEVTIRQIQETTAPDGASPLTGSNVVTNGVVTAIITGTSPGFFIQDNDGPWSGIYVFFNPTGINRGDSLRVTGTVVEFNGQTQLGNVGNVEQLGATRNVPTTITTTAASGTEPYESVLVTLPAARCTASGAFGQYTVNDNSGPVLVDDVIYAHPFSVGATYRITGVVQYAFNEWRVLPRDVDDVSVSTGVATRSGNTRIATWPNPAHDVLWIDAPANMAGAPYQLLDATGRKVAEGRLTGTRTAVDPGSLAPGSYLLVVEGASRSRVLVTR